MTDWKTLDDLPKVGQRVLVAAWEFGCAPVYAVCIFWQSSLAGQPPKFYLEDTFLVGPHSIAQAVRFWTAIPELPRQEDGEK